MAKFTRGRKRTNATIKGYYARARLLAAQGVPGSLKLTMQGFGRRGGYLLRMEKGRRRTVKQLKGLNNRRVLRPLLGS